MINLDEDTIEKFLLYKNFKDISDEEVTAVVQQLKIINTMYRKKIGQCKKYIKTNQIDHI